MGDANKMNLTADEIEEIREAFQLFDVDGNGSIDPHEMKAAMKSLGFDTANKSVYQMMMEIDKDKSGAIEFDEFLSMVTASVNDVDTREDIMHVFNLFDHEQKGFIKAENLRKVAEDLGESITDAEIKEMIARADTNQDNGIDRDEFFAIMTYGRSATTA